MYPVRLSWITWCYRSESYTVPTTLLQSRRRGRILLHCRLSGHLAPSTVLQRPLGEALLGTEPFLLLNQLLVEGLLVDKFLVEWLLVQGTRVFKMPVSPRSSVLKLKCFTKVVFALWPGGLTFGRNLHGSRLKSDVFFFFLFHVSLDTHYHTCWSFWS